MASEQFSVERIADFNHDFHHPSLHRHPGESRNLPPTVAHNARHLPAWSTPCTCVKTKCNISSLMTTTEIVRVKTPPLSYSLNLFAKASTFLPFDDYLSILLQREL